MATIFDFRSAMRGTAPKSRTLPQGCEIVLFPGVRYEYHVAPSTPDVASDMKPKRKASRKRDKLEIRD